MYTSTRVRRHDESFIIICFQKQLLYHILYDIGQFITVFPHRWNKLSKEAIMEKVLARYWWSFYIRGIIAIIIGLIAIFLPGITLEILAVLIGAFFLVDGIFSIAASFGSKSSGQRWWIFILEGVAGIVIGVLTFIWPQVTILALVLLIAAWALITGILEIIASFKLRKLIENEWLLALSGILSILFALILLISPGAGAVVIIWLSGVYAIFFGLLLIFLGRKLKRVALQ